MKVDRVVCVCLFVVAVGIGGCAKNSPDGAAARGNSGMGESGRTSKSDVDLGKASTSLTPSREDVTALKPTSNPKEGTDSTRASTNVTSKTLPASAGSASKASPTQDNDAYVRELSGFKPAKNSDASSSTSK